MGHCHRKVIATLLALLFANSLAQSVPFQTIEEGHHSGISRPLTDVYRTPQEFEIFWKKHQSDRFPPAPAPDINFASQMAVAVFMGTQNTGGYRVEITSVDNVDGELVVNFMTSSPPRGAVTTQALTQPYHIISLDASDENVDFLKSRKPLPLPTFPRFILILEDDADQDGIASEIGLLPAVTNVQVLSSLGIIFVDFDSDEISREEARGLLEDIDGVEEIEEEPSSLPSSKAEVASQYVGLMLRGFIAAHNFI
mmetsp:Transcript_13313/g.23842  ORF Transcript_13313/g.23842 Transcript_13313/m.23842 type:complete len:254 (-) Transcript_13313:18-779(-)